MALSDGGKSEQSSTYQPTPWSPKLAWLGNYILSTFYSLSRIKLLAIEPENQTSHGATAADISI